MSESAPAPAPVAPTTSAAPTPAPVPSAATIDTSNVGNNIGKILMAQISEMSAWKTLCEYNMNKSYALCDNPNIKDNFMIALLRFYILIIGVLLSVVFILIMGNHFAGKNFLDNGTGWVMGVAIYFIFNIIFFHTRLEK
tara:strand:- start:1303 stop:1719 length:417 start_codon:yes stop_codon:yes gene_type:complete